VKGCGSGGMGGGYVVERHLTKLLVGKDPFNIEQLWDICGAPRCTMAAWA
jgi:L-rhamnonate dehydratase